MSNSDSRSVIRFGAELGPIRQIGGVFNQQFNRARGSVSSLGREQTRLLRSIERAQDAGEDVSDLTAEYEALGEAIADAEHQVDLFNSAAGHVSTLGRLATALGGVAVAAVGVGGTILGMGAATNLHTAEVDGMAKSYGMAIDEFNAWGGLVARAGLEAESTGDLVEELGNKFGEFKALGKNSAVGEVFGALGVDQSMLEGLTAAQQFEFIMKRLQRVKDTQQAASLADILFGGEANKVVTYIRGTGQSIDDLLGSQKKFNLLTDEGAKGATAYSRSFNHLRGTVSTAWAEIAGIAGGEMTGEIDSLTQSVGDFVRENKTQLVGTLKDISGGIREFVGGVVWAASGVNRLVQGLGGWKVVGGAVASLFAAKVIVSVVGLTVSVFGLVSALGVGSAAMAAFNFIVAANPIGLAVVGVAAFIGAGWALYRNWGEVTDWFSAKLSWFGDAFPKTFGLLKTIFDYSPVGLVVNNWRPVFDFFKSNGGVIVDYLLSPISAVIDAFEVVGSMWSEYFGGNHEIKVTAPNIDSQQKLLSQVVSQVAPASQGATVHQRVERIEIVAAPGQSPEALGAAVGDALSGLYSQPLYDLPK